MTFTKLQSTVFYADIKVGLELFRDCLGFQITYDELNSTNAFCVLEKDNLCLILQENQEIADLDRPQLRLHTENIEEVYIQVSENYSHLLHPNSNKIEKKPWGAKEFALLDSSKVCVIIMDWS